MISDFVFVLFMIAIAAMLAFMIWSIRTGKTKLINRIYLIVSCLLIEWILCLIGMKFTDPNDTFTLFVLDSMIYIGCAFAPAFAPIIALSFIKVWDRLPKKYYLLFIIPAITNLMVWTNPYHHLFYQHFSVLADEVMFGPYMYVSGVYSYICLASSIFMMLNFAMKSHNALYMRQALLFSLGSFLPLVVSTISTFKLAPTSIVATPLGFIGTIVFHGMAIYYLHFLDIKPIAKERLLDWISDCYVIVSDTGLVVDCNHQFMDIFGKQYGIVENKYLQEGIQHEAGRGKLMLYNMLTAIESCKKTHATIAYEQAVEHILQENYQKYYYIVEVSPLLINEEISGFIVIFKDITKIKESMQRLQNSQARMMEQERLASLGQMVGGIAHNLKTPIMSISGSMAAMETLVEECQTSLGDPDVTQEDFCEIYGEMQEWVKRVRDACAYMSDIISAVKGQASSMSASNGTDFALDEVFRRVALLMRHELLSNNCRLTVQNTLKQEVHLHGDINNLVQVVNNLVTNAVDAQSQGGEIVIGVGMQKDVLQITVTDQGSGVPPEIKRRLFREMVTSKGTLGTGLGVFISNAVVKGKFGGSMWHEDNPEGGSIFGISIPKEYVKFTSGEMEERA